MGWLITGGILILLAVLPLGVRICYDDSGMLVRLIAGPVKLTVYPEKTGRKKKKKVSEQKAEEKKDSVQPVPQPPQPPKPKNSAQEKKGGSLLDFLPLAKLAFRLLGDFRRKLRVNTLQVKLILAGGDPCDLAVNYGKTWAAVSTLMPRLESWFTIRKRDIVIECDFVAPETLIYVCLDLTITLGRLLSLAVVYGVRAVIEYLNIQKKRKGGAVT